MGWRNVKMALAAGVVLAAAPAAGQVGNGIAPVTIPAPGPSAIPIPPPPVIALPTPTPTVAATPAPAAVATPRPAASRAPAPRPTPTASATPSPTPTASASPVAAPPVAPTPIATPTAAPSPSASPSPPLPAAADDGTGRYWLAALAAGVIALAALGWALLRRRRADAVVAVDDEAWVEEAPPAAATPAAPRARLTLAFRPKRAGVNLLSATSENEIVVSNIGDAAADDIRVQVRLFSAHGGQDAELAAFYAEPILRPAVPAFTLGPDEMQVMSAVAALPRDAIRSLTAAGRPMFVPIVAVNIVYSSGAGDDRVVGQLAQAFAVGVERVDSPKLAPFWLDTPPRTHDQVAARPHAAALER